MRIPILMALSILILPIGQMLLKKSLTMMGGFSLSSPNLPGEFWKLATSPTLILGLSLYGISSILWFDVLSQIELSKGIPVFSLTYVITYFASAIFLGESLSLIRFLGVITICFGIFLISRS